LDGVAMPGTRAGAGGAAGSGGRFASAAGAVAVEASAWAVAGALKGVDCTALTGALAGGAAGLSGGGAAGAFAAAKVAEGPADAVPPCAAVPAGLGGAGGGGGPGGGVVPTPNRPGAAFGDDGSTKGAAAAMCWALARSAINASAMFCNAARSGSSGLGGTLARLGSG
jgi:hypothetical protein